MASPLLSPPVITLQEDGKPFSPEYGDIYASRDGAAEQACSVFLKGNALPERWAGKDQFVILENGFGLGTNFLTTLKSWRQDEKRCHKLHFVSIEKHPPSAEQLVRFADPEVRAEAEELAAQWKDIKPGVKQLCFDGSQVVLTLYFMDSAEAAKKLALGFDALFLDGFSPKVNPAMWDKKLLKQLSHFAREGATLATWCVSSSVREALAESGFEVEKREGFGHKKWMTAGVFHPKFKNRRFRPPEAVPVARYSEAVVVGAGLTGAAVVSQLAKRKIKTTVIDAGPIPVSGASAIRWGLLHTQLSSDRNYLFRLTDYGTSASVEALMDTPEFFANSGLFQMAKDEEEWKKWEGLSRQEGAFLANSDEFKLLTSSEASEKIGMKAERGGIWHKKGGLVESSCWARSRLQNSGALIIPNQEVQRAVYEEGIWKIFGENGRILARTPLLIITAASRTNDILGCCFPVKDWKGRISLLRDTDLPLLKAPITGKGYVINSPDKWVVCGASYEEVGTPGLSLEEAHIQNLKKLQGFFAEPVDAVACGVYEGDRSVALDRLPIVGEIRDLGLFRPNGKSKPVEGLFVCFAMASRAITLSEICSRMLVAQIFGEPLPLESDLAKALSPNRFSKILTKA